MSSGRSLCLGPDRDPAAILATREIDKALGLPVSGLGNRLGVYFGTYILCPTTAVPAP